MHRLIGSISYPKTDMTVIAILCLTFAILAMLSSASASAGGDVASDDGLDVSRLRWEESSRTPYLDGFTLDEMEVSPDFRMAAVATGQSPYLHIIELGEELVLNRTITLSPGSFVMDVAWSPDGKYLAVANDGNDTLILDTGDWSVVRRLSDFDVITDFYPATRALDWSHDGSTLAGGHSWCLVLWNTSTWEKVYDDWIVPGIIEEMEWSPDDTMITWHSWDGYAVVSVEDKKVLRAEGDYWINPLKIRDVSWSPDGRYIAITSQDDPVQIYRCQDWALMRTVRPINLNPRYGSTCEACWSPDMRLFVVCATGHINITLTFWETVNWTIVREIHTPDNPHKFRWMDNLTSFVVGYFNISVQIYHVPHARVSDYNIPSEITTGEAYRLAVNVTSLLPLDAVTLHYRYPGRSEESMALEMGENNTYGISLLAPHLSGAMEYRIEIVDIFNRTSIGDVRTVPLIDNDAPWIDGDTSDQIAYAGHAFYFRVQASDNIAVQVVEVDYWFDDGAHIALEMSPGDPFTGEVVLPQRLGRLSYRITVVDTSGLAATSDIAERDIRDVDAPILSLSHGDDATTGDPFPVEVVVRDNIALSEAWVEWGVDGLTERIPIDVGGSSTSSMLIPVPHRLGTLMLVLRARDTSGNLNSTAGSSIPITDDDAPLLLEDLTPGMVGTGRDLVLAVRAWDNIGVAGVIAAIGFDGAAPSSLEMASTGDVFTVSVRVPLDARSADYRFTATDTSGNANGTDWRRIAVEDVLVPTVEGSGNGSVHTGEPFTLQAHGGDNRGAVTVTFHVRRAGSGWTSVERECGEEFDLAVTSDELDVSTEGYCGTFEWYVEATDPAGNVGTCGSADSPLTVEVVDVTAPVVSLVGPRDCVVGERVVYDASASEDDVGIGSVVWTVEGPEGLAWTGATVTSSFARAGEYRIRVEVADASGNVASLEQVTEVMERPRYSTTGVVPLLIILGVAASLVGFVIILHKRRGRAA